VVKFEEVFFDMEFYALTGAFLGIGREKYGMPSQDLVAPYEVSS